MFRNRNFSELMPLAGALGALTLGLACLLLGFGSLYQWIDKNDNEKSRAEASAGLPPMSEYAAAIATLDAAPVRTAQPRNVSQASGTDLGYDPAVVAQGQELFTATCSACHGPDAHGVVGLGKDLINSEYVHGLTDADLLNFIKTGRPIWDAANTTGIDMPPKGGNPALTDDQLLLIITFIRASSGVPATSSGEVAATTETAPDAVAVVPTSAPAEDANVDTALVAQGQELFVATCSACHGPDAHGIVGLGKDLINSEFIHSQTDTDLMNFIKTGRPIWDAANTTGIDMPPKGGNPALTDDQLLLIITFIRASSSTPVMTDTTPDAVAVVPTSPPAEDTNVSASLVTEGQELFVATCSACHGPDAHGVVGLGKDLVASEFVHGLTDADLLTFVKTGRPIWDAANTTGIDMPPKGGNPALTDDQILSIIAYIRSLQNPGGGS